MPQLEPLSILGIQPARTKPGGPLRFSAQLSGPDGPETIEVSAAALVHYERFQIEALEEAGIMFRYSWAEGRAPLAADEAWRQLVQLYLDHAREQRTQAAPDAVN